MFLISGPLCLVYLTLFILHALLRLFCDAQVWVTKVCGKGQTSEDLDGSDLIELIFYSLLGLNKSTE